MLETSKDLLFIVLAFCVLWLTIFVCWMIYYLAMILKEGNRITRDARETLDAVKDFFETAKTKFASSATYLALLGETLRQGIGFMKDKKKTGKK